LLSFFYLRLEIRYYHVVRLLHSLVLVTVLDLEVLILAIGLLNVKQFAPFGDIHLLVLLEVGDFLPEFCFVHLALVRVVEHLKGHIVDQC